MKKEFKIIPPTMPNFVRFEKAPQLRQDGYKVDEGFDIKNFTQEEAEEFAELMKTEFMKHWKSRTEQQKIIPSINKRNTY